jgi:hypothetical protein
MTTAFTDPSLDDDLHLLMAVAVLSGQRGTGAESGAIYEAWARAYPDDALGHVGRGLTLIGGGRFDEGYRIIERAAETARTRTDQARDVLATLRERQAELTA